MTVGFVAIGRNEGDRLKACLDSIRKIFPQSPVVYVDSGSSDGSADFAESIGCDLVELDMSKPFTAARARNQGWRMLLSKYPELEYVQFLDGDCVLDKNWIPNAIKHFEFDLKCGVVCGRRREIYPTASTYNYLCDLEWDTPVGPAKACGGDALLRVETLKSVQGYDDSVIAGEEPEMCVRIRQKGWTIFRHQTNMTYHDANILRFRQWWKRTVRCGYAYALGAEMHGRRPEQHWVKEKTRALVWGAGIPLFCIGLGLFYQSLKPLLLLLLIYLLQWFRLYMASKLPIFRASWACFTVLGKFAECVGILRFYFARLRGIKTSIIEYKN